MGRCPGQGELQVPLSRSLPRLTLLLQCPLLFLLHLFFSATSFLILHDSVLFKSQRDRACSAQLAETTGQDFLVWPLHSFLEERSVGAGQASASVALLIKTTTMITTAGSPHLWNLSSVLGPKLRYSRSHQDPERSLLSSILQVGKWSLRGRRNDTANVTQLGRGRATELGCHFPFCRTPSLTPFCSATI